MADDVVRFSTPDPKVGDPRPFVLEVIRELTIKHTDPPEDAPEDWQPWEEQTSKREEHQFHARADVSGGVLVQIDLMAAGGRGGNGANVRGGDALFDFYDAMLVPEDRLRFRDLIQDPKVYVHAQVLSDIAIHFYGVYSERPTTARDA